MSKLLRLEVSRPQKAYVYVTVDDDQDLSELFHGTNSKAIAKAIDEQDPHWDDDIANHDLTVDDVAVPEDEDDSDNWQSERVTDIAEELKAIKEETKRRHEEWKKFRL